MCQHLKGFQLVRGGMRANCSDENEQRIQLCSNENEQSNSAFMRMKLFSRITIRSIAL